MAPPSQLTGRCNCGTVNFVALGPFRPAKACHCTICRRQSGHFVAATEVDRGRLRIAGEEAVAWYAASAHARRGFCRFCGAHLFWERIESDRLSIWMGCLDQPTGLRLESHIFVGEKGDYYTLDDGLPRALESDTKAE